MEKHLRYPWCGEDPLYVAYHDNEWGVPERGSRKLFALLLLEGFQAGLSWITVLRKREYYLRGTVLPLRKWLSTVRQRSKSFFPILGSFETV